MQPVLTRRTLSGRTGKLAGAGSVPRGSVEIAVRSCPETALQKTTGLRCPMWMLRLAVRSGFGAMPMTHEGSSGHSRLNVRYRQWTVHVLLAFAVLLAIGYGVVHFLPQPPYAGIVDELPISARLVRHKLIRHGVDYGHVFEFSCADAALRERLVSRWQLRDLTRSKETPVSFMASDHLDWWTPDVSPATRRFGRCDDDSESYMSVWEHPETGRLYVEVGRW